MKIVLTLLLVLLIAPAQARQSSTREKIVHETLRMTLIVGMEMREQGKHPTWQEIQTEVARRLGVSPLSF